MNMYLFLKCERFRHDLHLSSSLPTRFSFLFFYVDSIPLVLLTEPVGTCSLFSYIVVKKKDHRS